MLDIKFIRENTDRVKQAVTLKKKKVDIDQLLLFDDQRKSLQHQIDTLKNEQKKYGKDHIEQAKKIKEQITVLETEQKVVEQKIDEIAREVPNIFSDDTPIGKDESENKVIRKWGEIPNFNFPIKDHEELAVKLGILDKEKASQISGSRFAYFKGDMVFLELAIIQYTFSLLTSEEKLEELIKKNNLNISAKPFIPVFPPIFMNMTVMDRMARLQPMEERYCLREDNLVLIGSAEHTLGPLHMDEIIDEKMFPIRYVGFSPSFRREAGSYGKDVKGILRMHQFDKIEMESFCLPENSIEEQNLFVAAQEELVQGLELPYQVVQICTGDMGGPDYRQIDIETYIPSQKKYRETHTADLMTDYQARRLNTKVKRTNGSLDYVHMNDATAFAIGRIIVAILENYQQADGSIQIPQALQKYMGKEKISPIFLSS